MSTPSQKKTEDQEIDLSEVLKKIGNLFEYFAAWVFNILLFVKRNIIVIALLFFGGIALGVYMDRKNNIYDHQIIVTPNFNSVDYLYAKIDLIEAKIEEGDAKFLKNVVGVKNPSNLKKIAIEPIPDIYRFVGDRPSNFEFIRLLGEDGDMNQVVKDKLTSKNYMLHTISFTTSGVTSNQEMVQPILDYLNTSEYFDKVKAIYISNSKIKIQQTDSTITQINGVLNSFSKNVNGSQANDKLVYYNENTQLNEVIKSKSELVNQLSYQKLDVVSTDKTIKEISTVINMKNLKFLNTNKKMLFPVLFLFIFIVLVGIKSFYNRQLRKSKQ